MTERVTKVNLHFKNFVLPSTCNSGAIRTPINTVHLEITKRTAAASVLKITITLQTAFVSKVRNSKKKAGSDTPSHESQTRSLDKLSARLVPDLLLLQNV